MKKKIPFLILCFIIFLFLQTCTVFAAKLETLLESGDYEDVKALTNRILEFVNDKPTGELNTRDATVEDIDFDNAVKVYVDLPIFQGNCKTFEEVKEILEINEYIWIVPIKVNGYLFEAFVDNIQGYWSCDMIFYPYEQGGITYTEQLDASLEANGINDEDGDYKYIMANGIPYIQYPVYILIKDGVLDSVIPARNSAAMAIEDSSDKNRTSRFKQLSEEKGAEVFPAYDFKRLQKSINENLESQNMFVDALTGGGGVIDIGKQAITPQYLWVLLIGAGIALLISGKFRKYFIN